MGFRIAISGSPGTGKTTLAKALSEHWSLPCIPEAVVEIVNADANYISSLIDEPGSGRGGTDPEASRDALVAAFMDWFASRDALLDNKPGFVSDRWELDLVGWWLMRFGIGSHGVEEQTHQLIQAMHQRSKQLDLVVVMSVSQPFTSRPNEQGLKRNVDLPGQVLNTALNLGLMAGFAQARTLSLPPSCKSVEERVNYISKMIESRA